MVMVLSTDLIWPSVFNNNRKGVGMIYSYRAFEKEIVKDETYENISHGRDNRYGQNEKLPSKNWIGVFLSLLLLSLSMPGNSQTCEVTLRNDSLIDANNLDRRYICPGHKWHLLLFPGSV